MQSKPLNFSPIQIANMPAQPDPRAGNPISAYMNYVSKEGIDLERFVEQGGRLLGRDEADVLSGGLPDLTAKIVELRADHPLLAKQLEFLSGFFSVPPVGPAKVVRDETAFALLYAAKDMDLMPDNMPGVGYLDDAAVVEVVLNRHEKVFALHCASLGLDWQTLKPNPAA
jgi:hypothetical protein